MVIKKRLIRRRPVVEEPEDEDLEPDDGMEPEEDEDLEPEEDDEPAPRKVSRGITPKVISKETPKPVPVAKAAPKPVEPDEDEEEPAPAQKIKVQKVEDTVIGSLITQAIQHLEDGKSLLITSLGNDKYSLGFSDHAPAAPSNKLRGKEYWETVMNADYLTWSAEWQEKSYEEKVKFAQKKKISWDSHPNPRVDVIRLTEAVRNALGIEKYKPEYRTRSARASLRE